MPKIETNCKPRIRHLPGKSKWDTRRLARSCECKIDNQRSPKSYEKPSPRLNRRPSRLNFAPPCRDGAGFENSSSFTDRRKQKFHRNLQLRDDLHGLERLSKISRNIRRERLALQRLQLRPSFSNHRQLVSASRCRVRTLRSEERRVGKECRVGLYVERLNRIS